VFGLQSARDDIARRMRRLHWMQMLRLQEVVCRVSWMDFASFGVIFRPYLIRVNWTINAIIFR
jgi:hypothetical protein